jgi:predicted branched-subunit amino acid permease
MTDCTAVAPTETPGDLGQAARETWVIWMGLFALGIGFGVLVTSHDLPWWLAPFISATMFAGSVEFILIGMLPLPPPSPPSP